MKVVLNLILFFVLFTLSISPSLASETNPQTAFWNGVKDFFGLGKNTSSWSDVKSWKPIGNRFASAYDTHGNLIAIYDLSYPDFRNPMTVGKISRNPSDATSMLSSFTAATQQLSASEIASLGTTPASVANSAFLPTGWWTSLPWNPNIAPKTEPAFFRITDLDLNQLQVGAPIISGLRDLFQVILQDTGALNDLADSDILNAFQFVRAPDGGYELQWNDPRPFTSDSRPRKLLDFVNPPQGLYDHIKIETLGEGLSEAISAIPVPVLQALLATVVSRVTRYAEMTETEHLEMLHEVAIETDEASIQDAVLGALSPSDQSNVMDSFEWARVTPMDVWKWIFKNPDAAWATDAQAAITCAGQAQQWLTANDQTISNLNARFAFGVDANAAKYLYLESNVCAHGNTGPTISINYSSPTRIAEDRLTKEWIGVGLEFGSHFVPVAGFLVTAAYGFLIQNAVDHAEIWEARLLQHLERRTENWETEFSILEHQRVNPFEMNHDDMETLIASRRQQLGI